MQTFEIQLKRLERNDPTLTEFYGRDVKIEDKSAKRLSNALEKNAILTSLVLIDTKISTEGVKSIANALLTNATIKQLTLRYCGIENDQAKYIAAALVGNTTLTSLFLDDNKIGDEGCIIIGMALLRNTTLKTLDLQKNRIKDQGAKSIARALAKNNTLTRLDLSMNDIGYKGADATALMLVFRENLNYTGPGNDPRTLAYFRTKFKHQNARNAVVAILLIAKAGIDRRQFENVATSEIIAQIPSDLYRIMAELAWSTRDDDKWFFKPNNPAQQRGEERSAKRQNTRANDCIGCPTRIGQFVEENRPKNIFCSTYCQFIHHHNLPDLRGMTPTEIKSVLQ